MAKIKTKRLFIAINPPQDARDTLGSVVNNLKGLVSGVKWVDKENMHITLQFLGETGEEEAAAVNKALSRLAGKYQSFFLELAGITAFPSLDSARVIVAACEQNAEAARVKHEIDKELRSVIGYKPDRRTWVPHITLGRVKKGCRVKMGDKRLPQASSQFQARSIDLMSSRLSPVGPEYNIENSYELG